MNPFNRYFLFASYIHFLLVFIGCIFLGSLMQRIIFFSLELVKRDVCYSTVVLKSRGQKIRKSIRSLLREILGSYDSRSSSDSNSDSS